MPDEAEDLTEPEAGPPRAAEPGPAGGPPARYRVEGHLTFHTFAHLLLMAESFARSADERERGSAHARVGSVIFSAFAFEATLNHIGRQKVRSWQVEEPRRSWRQKLDLIVAECNVVPPPERGRRPFQSVAEAFGLRDRMAHGKTEVAEVRYAHAGRPGDGGRLEPDWLERYSDREVAGRILGDVREAIGGVLKGAGLNPGLAGVVATGAFRESSDR